MNRDEALRRLNVDPQRKLLLCLDGGGIRGILTIQLLKAMEEQAGCACHEFVDMVAGTSTGGIIAALIAAGHNASDIESHYQRLVKRVFKKRNWIAHQFMNPPLYTKSEFRAAGADLLGDLSLGEAVRRTHTDLLITSKDAAAGEETFFACFEHDGDLHGTYRDALLRSVMESTMSAPTYFFPFERFVDGGVTTYNNPSLGAITEAVRYAPDEKYRSEDLTVISLGTGARQKFAEIEGLRNPEGSDVYFWMRWLMAEASVDASDMQCYLLRTRGLFPGMQYRRFDISLDIDAVRQLPDAPLQAVEDIQADSLHELSDEELSSIALDNVAYFPVMKAIGEAMVARIRADQDIPFGADLVNAKGNDLLVTRRGRVAEIKRQMADPAWLASVDP